jgi:crotonobetainyl-CoA:carnitine CoA-transferase CaiB-like acyl-CoA transferase
VFVPGAYFQSTLRHPVGPGNYLAWMATSLATVAGALGASLEHEDTVRQGANDSEDGSAE